MSFAMSFNKIIACFSNTFREYYMGNDDTNKHSSQCF